MAVFYSNIMLLLSLFLLNISSYDMSNNTPLTEEFSVNKTEIQYFIDLVNVEDETTIKNAIDYINSNWKSQYEIMVLELLYFNLNNYKLYIRLVALLQVNSGKSFGTDFNKWYEYIWNKDQKLISDYHFFKAALHKKIDSRFETYFLNRQDQTTIRLDEIRWGGVLQDGIPPLRNPKMISTSQASYLNDDDIIFGIEVNGDARAYPKRILAWHEMFTDVVGGISVTGVYCTLCGTVILYNNKHKETTYQLGTSGFLYRSNKLMYDKETQSLWNTLWGTPVVGPLVGKDIQLDYMSVVTTTWGEWKLRHENTKVLSLETGHTRDYREGVAYKSYFANDDLMFNVPKLHKKLKNKQSILAIRLPNYPEQPYAISVKFLKKNPLYALTIAQTNMVVLTDKTGANRVYEIGNTKFSSYDQKRKLIDTNNSVWTVSENQLKNERGKELPRVHTFNAFWFGWKAAYPETKLIK